jgi:5-methylcytosine-specific restriction enzyme subunit McrC
VDSNWLAWGPRSSGDADAPAPAVPVANLFYLLCYARNRLDARDLIDVASLEGAQPVELLAEMLVAGVRRLRLRGLPRRYRTRTVDTRAPRGRIELTPSITRALLPRGRVQCTVDELSADIAVNRVLKAAMRVLAGRPGVSRPRRRALRSLVVALGQVSDAPLDAAALRAARAATPAGLLDLMLTVCELVHLGGLPTPGGAGTPFLDLGASPQVFGRLFEDFVAGWLRHEQTRFGARKAQVPWDLDDEASGSRALLPTMEADVLLTAADRRVVVECKAYARSLDRAYGVSKVRTSHLYQLLAYVSQLGRDGGPPVSGLLLYARAEADLDLQWWLAGHEIRVRTLDLGRPWTEIDAALRALVATLGD